jgi:hypothetical protein
MSLRASASLPSSASGEMYWKVPTMVPSTVNGVVMVGDAAMLFSLAMGIAAFANPKSSSLAPSLVSMTLPGLRSRWMIP